MTRPCPKLADHASGGPASGRREPKQKIETNGEPSPLLLGLREAMRDAQG